MCVEGMWDLSTFKANDFSASVEINETTECRTAEPQNLEVTN